MEAEEFEGITNDVLGRISETLTSKAGEYARGDRLSNFKQIAHLLGVTPEKALIGLVTKHYVALVDFVNDLDSGKNQSMGRWDEKTHDIMAYMVLMKALNIERERNEQQKVETANASNVDSEPRCIAIPDSAECGLVRHHPGSRCSCRECLKLRL